jgi:hypothetical protein
VIAPGIAPGRNPRLPRSSRSALKVMNLSPRRGIMARVRTFVFGGTKGAREAAASPLPSPAVLSPSVVLRFRFLPDFATEGT